ncbi:hypothetical protein CVT25_000603 [Psilocybe cyanescens]|uniref:Uncharacterized protein n=1 Tax=Psilocybe cyanescens TaxID=93625 RepID=A0A409XUJ9_PSICY|nr:hypothetical protein CVT25_000603 [Psilocybe cyanescens]
MVETSIFTLLITAHSIRVLFSESWDAACKTMMDADIFIRPHHNTYNTLVQQTASIKDEKGIIGSDNDVHSPSVKVAHLYSSYSNTDT